MALNKANVNFLKSNGYYDLNKIFGNWFDNGSQLSGGQWQKIAYATKIVVLEGGEIVGVGSHDKLMKDCSIYREMYHEELKDING